MNTSIRALDPQPLLASLDIGGVTNITPLTSGWGNTAIWRVDCESTVYALRLFQHHETAAMQLAAGGSIPVPHVHASGTWDDYPYLLLSWCPGVSLGDDLRYVTPAAVTRFEAFGAVQARIHRIEVPAGSLLRPRDWIAWAGPDAGQLRSHLQSTGLATDRLIHLDYHPLNVTATGDTITGVLDWTNAGSGDPRADIARTLTILRTAPIPGSTDRLTGNRRRLADAWWRGYERIGGPVHAMPVFLAWAGAAMIEDLTPKLDRPETGLRDADLERVRRQTAYWKYRAGISN